MGNSTTLGPGASLLPVQTRFEAKQRTPRRSTCDKESGRRDIGARFCLWPSFTLRCCAAAPDGERQPEADDFDCNINR